MLVANRSFALSPPQPGFVLRPCVFWFDSNHLVHIARALEIYAPYTHASDGMRSRLGGKGLNRFRLRRGDFIEDRFGVEQRNLLMSLRDEPQELVRTFDWFGCYMLEETVGGEEDEVEVDEVEVDGEDEVEERDEVVEEADIAGATANVRMGGSFLDRMRTAPLMLDRQGRVTFVVHTNARDAKLPSQRLDNADRHAAGRRRAERPWERSRRVQR